MADFLILQTGDYLLLQTGDKLLLAEQSDTFAFTLPLLQVQFNGNLETVGELLLTLPLLTAQFNGQATNPTVGSGLYKLVPNKTNDTYYSSLVPVTETDVKIP